MDGILGSHVPAALVMIMTLSSVIPLSNAYSFWGELLHPTLQVSVTSKIPGVVNVKCISSEDDIRLGVLDGSKNETFTFDVEMKFFKTIRYNCILKRGRRGIGQFLGFRSGPYCQKGCDWVLYPDYAQRLLPSSRGTDFVKQKYKPIGSPDDYDYDLSGEY